MAPLDTNWKKATVLMALSVGADNQPLTAVRNDFDIFPLRRQGVGRQRFGRGGWGSKLNPYFPSPAKRTAAKFLAVPPAKPNKDTAP